jgi:hypothetical protein
MNRRDAEDAEKIKVKDEKNQDFRLFAVPQRGMVGSSPLKIKELKRKDDYSTGRKGNLKFPF